MKSRSFFYCIQKREKATKRSISVSLNGFDDDTYIIL